MTQAEGSLSSWNARRTASMLEAVHTEGAPPVLLVVIDTEEEFDWSGPFDRAANSVNAFGELPRLHDIFRNAGARPTYVIDYPVASTAKSIEILKEFGAGDDTEIGAHLHPWVNPPFGEEVCARNSYPGNLDASLEEQKLATLISVIKENFGAAPRTYKAGRYGAGPNTYSILKKLNIHCDLSLAPPFDFRGDGGPNYLAAPQTPFWLDQVGGMLEIPTTGGYYGALRGIGAPMDALISHAPAKLGYLARGAAARFGIVTRARLSPEGYSFDELKRLTKSLLARGVRTLTLSLHSPSAAVGYTSYAADKGARDRLLATCRDYLSYFRDEIGGGFATASEFRQSCINATKD